MARGSQVSRSRYDLEAHRQGACTAVEYPRLPTVVGRKLVQKPVGEGASWCVGIFNE